MRQVLNQCEYIAQYVDDLAIVSNMPKSIVDKLLEVHVFKLKGTRPIQYHLECDSFRDSDQVLCMIPRKYIEQMVENYEKMFGTKPKQTFTSPLSNRDHPELDTSPELDIEVIKKY